MSKLAIQWLDENDVLVVREFDEDVAARQVLLGYATFVAPSAETDRALEQARQRLSDSARNVEAPMTPGLDFARGLSRLDRARALCYGMKRQ